MNRIKEARKRAGIKQTDLCTRLGVSQGALSGWENGRYDPGASVWLRLSQILGVSLEYLMGGDCREDAAGASALDEDERQLLAGFHSLDARGRAAVLDALRSQLRFCTPAEAPAEAPALPMVDAALESLFPVPARR